MDKTSKICAVLSIVVLVLKAIQSFWEWLFDDVLTSIKNCKIAIFVTAVVAFIVDIFDLFKKEVSYER